MTPSTRERAREPAAPEAVTPGAGAPGAAAPEAAGLAAARPGDARPRPLVEVEFCALGNYRRPAERLARAVREESGAAAELVPGRGGVFEVTVAGELVFSKRATARLPETEEILYHVRAALARNPR